MPFDQTPERGGGDDGDFTFTLNETLSCGNRCLVVMQNMGFGLTFTAPTDMPKGTVCSVQRLAEAPADLRWLGYRLEGIAAEFILIAQVVRAP